MEIYYEKFLSINNYFFFLIFVVGFCVLVVVVCLLVVIFWRKLKIENMIEEVV